MGSITKHGKGYRVLIRKAGIDTISESGFAKKSEAEARMKEIETALNNGTWFEDTSNLGVLIANYLEDYGPFRRDKVGHLKGVKAELGHLNLNELTSPVIIKFARKRGEKVHPSTVQKDMLYLGSVLKAAEAAYDCTPKLDEFRKASHFLRSMRIVSESDEREVRMTDAEIDRVIDSASTKMPFRDIVKFAVLSAMRRGEILDMTWDELGEDGRTIGLWRKCPRKGKRYVRVPLQEEAAKIVQRQERTSSRIFPYRDETLSNRWRAAAKKAGLQVRFHDLRHEGISRLFELGYDIMRVQLFSGHRDLNMLKRYTHLNADKVVAAMDAESNNDLSVELSTIAPSQDPATLGPYA